MIFLFIKFFMRFVNFLSKEKQTKNTSKIYRNNSSTKSYSNWANSERKLYYIFSRFTKLSSNIFHVNGTNQANIDQQDCNFITRNLQRRSNRGIDNLNWISSSRDFILRNMAKGWLWSFVKTMWRVRIPIKTIFFLKNQIPQKYVR